MNHSSAVNKHTHLFKSLLSFYYCCCFKLVNKKLHTIKIGALIINYNNTNYYYGIQNASSPVILTVKNAVFFSRLVFKGHIGFAEAYANNECSTSNLTQLLTLFAKNINTTNKAETGLSWLFNTIRILAYRLFEKNNLKGSKKNIYAHYDLGNNLFKLFLDKNMQYSSAIYNENHLTLEQAQVIKMKTICDQLQLTKTDCVLEIGSGWGGLSIFIAKTIGCKITTVTISKEQYTYAKEKIKQENVSDLISIQLKDYRAITGEYDKIVSVEMIEAVGHQYYQGYFEQCQKLLKQGGIFLMQAILIADHRYKHAKNSVDFIKQYIFPGSNIPSLNQLNLCANKSHMRLDKYSDITSSYVSTLYTWQETFNQHSQQLIQMGYDNYFQKLWNFYFSYCQAGFAVEHIRDAHLIFKKI